MKIYVAGHRGMVGGGILCQLEACDAAGATLLPLAVEESLTAEFTPLEYCSGEPWHMDEPYGEIVLNEVINRLIA